MALACVWRGTSRASSHNTRRRVGSAFSQPSGIGASRFRHPSHSKVSHPPAKSEESRVRGEGTVFHTRHCTPFGSVKFLLGMPLINRKPQSTGVRTDQIFDGWIQRVRSAELSRFTHPSSAAISTLAPISLAIPSARS